MPLRPDQADEAARRDPILRLDQFIHRQDEMIKLLKVQLEVSRVLAFQLGVLIFLALVLVVYLVWK